MSVWFDARRSQISFDKFIVAGEQQARTCTTMIFSLKRKQSGGRRKHKQPFTATPFFIFIYENTIFTLSSVGFQIDLMWRWIKITGASCGATTTKMFSNFSCYFLNSLSPLSFNKFQCFSRSTECVSFAFCLINHSEWINTHARSRVEFLSFPLYTALLIVKGYGPSLCFAFM